MNIRNEKWMQIMTRIATILGCLCAGAFLFMASPIQAEAIVLGSGNQGSASSDSEEGDSAEEADGSEDTAAEGSTVTSVTVTSDSVNIRSDASTSSDKAGKAEKGDELEVTGEKKDSSGKTWYAVSFEKDGDTVTGYIRYDLVEAHEAAVEPETEETVPAETEETSQEQESTPAVTDEYYVQYEDDGTGSGTSEWYLHDNTMGNRYKISELMSAQETNQKNQELLEKQTGSLKLVIFVMAAVILVLIVVVTVFIIKLKNAYDDDYDEDDEDEEEDEEEEEYDEEEEEEERPRRRGFGRRRVRYEEEEEDEEEDEDDEDEEEEERPRRKAPAKKPSRTKPARRARYEEEEEEEDEDEDEEEYRPSRKASKSKGDKNWQSKNFLDDDDLEFEFLDLK